MLHLRGNRPKPVIATCTCLRALRILQNLALKPFYSCPKREPSLKQDLFIDRIL